MDGNSVNFTDMDVEVLGLFASFAAVSLRTLGMYHQSQREYQRSSRLLNLVHNLSSASLGSEQKLLQIVMDEVQLCHDLCI